jgi:GTP:adenosylcobinamide-phosphate guanylyltransferase
MQVTLFAVVHQKDLDAPLTILLAPADYPLRKSTRLALVAQNAAQIQLLKVIPCELLAVVGERVMFFFIECYGASNGERIEEFGEKTWSYDVDENTETSVVKRANQR